MPRRGLARTQFHESRRRFQPHGLAGLEDRPRHSNGQTEGRVGRLKLIKRAGYGRAKVDLLRKRVLRLA